MAATQMDLWGRVAHSVHVHWGRMGPSPERLGLVCTPFGVVGAVVAGVQLLEQMWRGRPFDRYRPVVDGHERGTLAAT